MSLSHDNPDCILDTPAPTRKRPHGSATNLRSEKRRRISMTSVDLGRGLDTDVAIGTSSNSGSLADRFVSNRPKAFLPLNITPRTRRISKQFGLVDDRVLTFRDDTEVFPSCSSSYKEENTMALLRRSASSLFNTEPPVRPYSVTENLNKQKHCLMVLDSPGVSKDPDAYPMTWSRRNLIAVVCKNEIYYQNLDTKTVSHLCTSTLPGTPGVIQWAGQELENHIASGNTVGVIQVWDAGCQGGTGKLLHNWRSTSGRAIKSFSWNGNVLAMGIDDGELSLIDVRTPNVNSEVKQHRAPVLGLQWSADGMYLASGDKDGVVHIWDRRAGKSLLDSGDSITKMRHKGNARALAWCPWKPDLLATGTTAPEGKIRIWSTSSISSHSPTPVQIIPLNTSVLSLHWSPHCKELLSTHGQSFMPLPKPRHQSTSTTPIAQQLSYTKTPLTNSITVHQYPSCKRLMTLTNAHSNAVTHSCLSPNGESIFTVCPREETIKMWQVWSQRPPVVRRESAFDKYTIR